MSIQRFIPRMMIIYLISFILSCVVIFSIYTIHMLYDRTSALLHDQWSKFDIVLILNDNASEESIDRLMNRLKKNKKVYKTRLISPDEGWEMLHEDHELIPALKIQGGSSLPNVVMVSPFLTTLDDFNALTHDVQKDPSVAYTEYNQHSIESILSHAHSFRFVAKSVVWIIGILSLGMILLMVRYALVPHFMSYIVIILKQSAAGTAGALCGWMIFNILFYGEVNLAGELMKEMFMAMGLGIFPGFMVGIFSVISYHQIRSHYPFRRMQQR